MSRGEARRLHPGTVAVRLVRQLPSTLLGLPAFLAVAGRGELPLIALVALGLAVVAGVVTWAQWRAFSYTVDADGLTIAEGVLGRSRRTVPRARIQDVSVEQKALQRLFGLAAVRVETGGDDKNEGTLDSVSLPEARRLRNLLRDAGGGAGVVTGEVDAPVPERVLFAMSPRRVITLGLFRFSFVWLAGIYAVLQALDGVIDLDQEAVLEWLGVARRELEGGGGALLAVAALVPAALLLGVVAGLVRTVLGEWNFCLAHADGRFRRRRGLVTRTEVVVATTRVQLSLVERGLVSGRLGWAGLRFQTLGGSDDPGGRQAMAPFARDDEIARVQAAAGLPMLDRTALRPVGAGHVVRMLLAYAALPTAAALAAAVLFPAALLLLLVLPMPVAAALLARRRHRYGLVGDALHVVRGTITAREWVVPLDRVQAVSVTASWLQRRLGTATVRVGTAGGQGSARPDVVDLPRADAAALAARLVA